MNNEPTYIEAYFQRAEQQEKRIVHQEMVNNQSRIKPRDIPVATFVCRCHPDDWDLEPLPNGKYFCYNCEKIL